MEVLRYKYKNAYEIQVSSTDISASWNKFKVRARKLPPEQYCSYDMHHEGQLYLYNPEKYCLEEVLQGEWKNTRPVFFEDHKYNLSFTVFDAQGEPRIIHPNKEVEAMFSCVKIATGAYVINSNIDFLNQPGHFALEFAYQNKDNKQIQHKIEFDVLSPKLDTKHDLDIIIQQIRAEYGDLVFRYLTLTFQQFEMGREANNELIWLSVFKQIVDNYTQAIRFILHQPHNKMMELEEYRRAERIKGWNSQLAESFINDKLIDENKALHKYYRTQRVESTTDTRENRFVKFTLDRIIERLSLLMKRLSNGTSESEIKMFEDKKAELEILRRNSFFSGIGLFDGFRQQSMVLQQRSGYSQVYRYWIMLQNGLDLIQGDTSVGVQPIWKLYELWCFLKVKQLVCKVLRIDPYNKDHIKKYIHEDTQNAFDLFNGGSLSGNVTYVNPQNEDLVEVGYQYSFNRGSSKDDMRSATTEQKPDIVMHIHKHNHNITLTYLYDAKYRVKGDEDEQSNNVIDEPVAETLDAMHHYRDAIYYGRRGEQKFSKEIIGGYILFPGRMNEQQMLAKIQNKEGHLPYYLQSIAEVNIGAYPLLPNEESGLLLENHLRRVLLDESILQQLEVSVPQRGLVYTDDPELALSKKWNRTKVLVFVDVTESHWKKIDNQSFDSVSVGIEMDLHAFGVVKDFTKAKYVVITNAGKDDKFKYRLYKIKGEPKLVYEIDTETCISTTYTNPKPDVTYLDKEGKPIKHKIVQSAYIQFIIDNPENSLQMPRLSRDKIESTKKEGEDRHRPRIAKMSEIVE